MNKTSISEATKNMEMQMRTGSRIPELYKDTFIDLRQSIMALANGVDKGVRSWVLQDPDCKSAICVRVSSLNVFVSKRRIH